MSISETINRLKGLLYDIKLLLLPLYHRIIIGHLRRKHKINVVFVAMNLSMWRYQGICEKLSKNSKFNVVVLILPCVTYSPSQQERDRDALVSYFKSRNIPYVIGRADSGTFLNIRQELSPDIMFYPQPYELIFNPEVDFKQFYDKLLCYIPYAFWTSTGDFSYNCPLHNKAWKLFYSTSMHQKDGVEIARNKGRNIEVVGYPNADEYLFRHHIDTWRPQSRPKKRVIWAPHFSIYDGGPIKQSNFLWMAELMLELAKKYSDRIQFAFKPHPVLYSELCKHKEWGIKRTDSYYKQWCTLENCQLETGEFIDLFMTSDAMIHDCGSFCVEYLYSRKPVMFVSCNFAQQLEGKSEFGVLALRQHYIGQNSSDIIEFLENVVLAGNDSLFESRDKFCHDYLIPPNGQTVADNIYNIFTETFNCKD